MRTCNIYKLEIHQEAVPIDTAFHQTTYYSSKSTVFDRGNRNYLGSVDEDGVTIYTPIQEFYTYKLPEYLKESFAHSEYYIEDIEYIVLDEHLEKLLAGKYLNQISDIQEQLDRSTDKFMKLHQEFDTFKSMSFWERVKFLFKGDKYE